MFYHEIISQVLFRGLIFVYSFSTAIYSPLPSEAPMFVFSEISRLEVLFWCAAGKSFGAYLVFIFGWRLRESDLFVYLLRKVKLQVYWIQFSHWSTELMNSYGIAGFFLLMSTPCMPMRTAIYSVSLTETSRSSLVLAVALGTIVRNSIVYWGIKTFYEDLVMQLS